MSSKASKYVFKVRCWRMLEKPRIYKTLIVAKYTNTYLAQTDHTIIQCICIYKLYKYTTCIVLCHVQGLIMSLKDY